MSCEKCREVKDHKKKSQRPVEFVDCKASWRKAIRTFNSLSIHWHERSKNGRLHAISSLNELAE